MTIREVLARVDTIRPNAYTDGEKIAMLNTIEGRIYRLRISRENLFPSKKERRSGSLRFPFPTQTYMCFIWRL